MRIAIDKRCFKDSFSDEIFCKKTWSKRRKTETSNPNGRITKTSNPVTSNLRNVEFFNVDNCYNLWLSFDFFRIPVFEVDNVV